MNSEGKLALIKNMMENEDDNLFVLNQLGGAELLELQAIADKITEQIAVVFMARRISAEREDKFGEENDGD